jgi:predicted permease
VVAQVAMTLVLLVGAGLLGRSFLHLLDVRPGFRTTRAVVLDVSLPDADDDAALRQRTRFYDDLVARLRALPGVSEVGAVDALPLSGQSPGNGTFLIMSRPDEQLSMDDLPRLMKDSSRTGSAEFRLASGGYFRAMGVPLLRGRLFDDRDAPDAPHVALISASLAKARWPTEDPIGKVIQFGNMDGDLRPFTIVGVVGDVREASLATPPAPTFYAFYRQRPRRAGALNIVIQGPGRPDAIIAAARRAVHELRPDVPPRLRTIEAVVSGSVADRRFVLVLIGVFGGAALLLATLGVYSVIAYLTTQRRQEIGIRVALGARAEDVLRLVLEQGAALALVGIAVGTAVALALTRVISGMLYGVSATDPLSFAAVIVVLVAVALLASLVPARRAARVEPMSILRGG